jgi:hypothetical protein
MPTALSIRADIPRFRRTRGFVPALTIPARYSVCVRARQRRCGSRARAASDHESVNVLLPVSGAVFLAI